MEDNLARMAAHRQHPEGGSMSRILLGILCGFVFGVMDLAIMLPMSFPDKRAAIRAAFIARLELGLRSAQPDCPGRAGRLVF
jgi:hypothetical protein